LAILEDFKLIVISYTQSGTRWESKFPGISGAFNVMVIKLKETLNELNVVINKDNIISVDGTKILIDLNNRINDIVTILKNQLGELEQN